MLSVSLSFGLMIRWNVTKNVILLTTCNEYIVVLHVKKQIFILKGSCLKLLGRSQWFVRWPFSATTMWKGKPAFSLSGWPISRSSFLTKSKTINICIYNCLASVSLVCAMKSVYAMHKGSEIILSESTV